MAFIRSYAAVEAIGRLGRDAQIRTTSSGKQFTTFSLAVTERAGKDGAEKTQWFDVSYFGSVEPRFVALLKTGTLVFVRSELPVKTAVTDKGSRVYTGIRAREVVVLAGRREDSSEPSTTSTRKQVAHPFEDLPPSDGEGCDIPF